MNPVKELEIYMVRSQARMKLEVYRQVQLYIKLKNPVTKKDILDWVDGKMQRIQEKSNESIKLISKKKGKYYVEEDK